MKIKNIFICLVFSSTAVSASQLNLLDLVSESDEAPAESAEAEFQPASQQKMMPMRHILVREKKLRKSLLLNKVMIVSPTEQQERGIKNENKTHFT